jgi:crotonobetainyl-CoA:carnitine CoA-transferase CaiB-like acyl-CoA transferase
MLNGFRVLDLTDERGYVAGWMLGELGADVVAIEPPEGSRARRQGPFADDVEDLESALPWWAYARNKRSVALDLASESGRETLRTLVRQADLFIESESPGTLSALGLGYADLAELNPQLIYTSITPFGQDGPKASWAATDFTVLAAGGPLWLCGDDDRSPLRISVPQAFAHAGAEAAAASLVALRERHGSSLGQHIDISAQQAATLATQSDIVASAVGDPPARRFSGGTKVGQTTIRMVYPARDGYVSITHVFGGAIGPATARMMERVCADGFCSEEMRDKDWVGYGLLLSTGEEPREGFEAAKAAVAMWTASKTKAELLADAVTYRLLIAPCSSAADVLSSEQFGTREFFTLEERPDGRGHVRMPGPMMRFSAYSRPAVRPAPRMGEHTQEVIAEWNAGRRSESPEGSSQPTSSAGSRPLEGVKILDFMWAIAGPMSTRILADYGATVIRVESSSHIDACRTIRPFMDGKPDVDQSLLFQACNASKKMITVDLSKDEGRAVIEDLVAWSDVVCESFSPGTISNMGFGYERLCEIKPDLIMLSTSLMGQSGPLTGFAGYGNLAAAIAGFYELVGWSDRPPAGPFGAYTDYIAPKFCATALLAAIEHHRRTGVGQHIDVSQAEAALHFLAPALLDYTVNDRMRRGVGNHDLYFAPHGGYPCDGEDVWIAIAAGDESEWRALCGVLDCDSLLDDARFRSRALRIDNAAELDVEIGTRTAAWNVTRLETALQEALVPAHAILDSHGLIVDPQLVAREHFVPRGDGGAIIESTRTKLSRTPAQIREGLALYGRDTHDVLSNVLGYEDDRITELVIAGVLE